MLISGDSTINIWEPPSYTLTHSIGVPLKQINDVKFTNDGKSILIGGNSSNLFISNLYKDELKFVKTKGSDVTSVNCSSDGSMFACGNKIGTISVYSMESHEEISGHSAHKFPISSVIFSPDCQSILGGDLKGKISIASFGKPTLLPKWTSRYGAIHHLSVSLNSNIMGIACGETVRLYDFKAQCPSNPIRVGKTNKICFSPTSSKLMIIGTESGDIKFIDTTTMKTISELNYKYPITALDMKYDGIILAVGTKSPELFAFDCRNMEKIFTVHPKSFVRAAVFQPHEIDDVPFFKKNSIERDDTDDTLSFDRLEKEVFANLEEESPEQNIISKPASPQTSPSKSKNIYVRSVFSENEKIIKNDQIEIFQQKEETKITKNESSDIKEASKNKIIKRKEPENEYSAISNSKIEKTSKDENIQKINRNEEYTEKEDSSLEEPDLSKLSPQNRELFSLIMNHIDMQIENTKEEFHSHLNSIHLDMICRIRELNDKIDKLKNGDLSKK
ncbi:PQQ-binding-like beta-propeller repeat protein [Histomonas meleagridis]|uniref:PQQ-binding-like beta-propeller repeat protein n=1 Tax=Histomonas meleagridis TaxID=135588 RepID=UPI00355A953A|nr:PQQ-binding-like beta-propeller repeat protein [Histomonas meleagridis]KAH0797483.1 PQQ-binding-like beta-propeller repeat protein [Histomonas meleagridis]